MQAVREVTLKLKVSNAQSAGDSGITVTFYPDYNDERNKAWSKYTPAASLQMTVKNEIVEEILQPGRNFLVTLTPED